MSDEIKLWATGLLMFGGAAMIFARRYNNPNKEVGLGIAFWVVLMVIFFWQ